MPIELNKKIVVMNIPNLIMSQVPQALVMLIVNMNLTS